MLESSGVSLDDLKKSKVISTKVVVSTDSIMNSNKVPEPNRISRFFADGCKLRNACKVVSYRLVSCKSTRNHIRMPELDPNWGCLIHGRDCIGHLECDNNHVYTMLPSYMTPKVSETVENRYQRYKRDLCSNHIDKFDYIRLTSKIMMGKKGLVRLMNSITVDGSMKMVISISESGEEGVVRVPSTVASSIMVPIVSNGIVTYDRVHDGDWALLVRQPCLWSGGIQPVRIKVTEPVPVKHNGKTWDVNWTIGIPPEMCSPYAADFDGEEMSLFPLRMSDSIKECESFVWSYGTLSDSGLHSQLVPRSELSSGNGFREMCIRATICWTDTRTRGFKITQALPMH
jgi:hypothetical protein